MKAAEFTTAPAHTREEWSLAVSTADQAVISDTAETVATMTITAVTLAIIATADSMTVRGGYMGYISSNGTVYNRSGSLIGRATNVPQHVVALIYFYGIFPLR